MPHPSLRPLLGAAALGALLGACAAPKPAAQIPPQLQAPAAEKAAFILAARGVQIYDCKTAADGKLAWAFVAPQAELLDARGNVVGDHGAGPFWAMPDGSRINGTVKQRADAPGAGNIPWLLLATQSTGGAGKMANITSVQRINTVGGVAPAGGCAATADVGKQAKVPYTTDYVFFVAR